MFQLFGVTVARPGIKRMLPPMVARPQPTVPLSRYCV